jgi:hypothetical protein
MKIAVVDGQGGGLGKVIIEKISKLEGVYIIALGTNSIATSNMLKAGANAGATGENAIKVNCAHADVIMGATGIIVADSMMGEVTAEIALAISQSPAKKVLVPVNRCNVEIAGISGKPISELIDDALIIVKSMKAG